MLILLLPGESNLHWATGNFSIIKKFFYFWNKSKVIEKLFYYIVTYSYLLLPLFFIISHSKKRDFIPSLLAIYGVMCFLFLLFYSDIPKDLRQYFKTAYTFFEYAVFTAVFWVNIRQAKVKHLIVVVSILFFAFQIFYLVTGKVRRLDSIPIAIETILLLIYILYFFYQFSKDLSTAYIYNHYGFWVAVGVLIYLGGSFFFFILIDHLDRDEVIAFGNITYVAEIIKNILFATAIYIYAKHPFKTKPVKQVHIPYLDTI